MTMMIMMMLVCAQFFESEKGDDDGGAAQCQRVCVCVGVQQSNNKSLSNRRLSLWLLAERRNQDPA